MDLSSFEAWIARIGAEAELGTLAFGISLVLTMLLLMRERARSSHLVDRLLTTMQETATTAERQTGAIESLKSEIREMKRMQQDDLADRARHRGPRDE